MADPIKIEGVKLIFCNFEGKGNAWTRDGDRNFSIVLDEEIATRLMDENWNVKTVLPSKEGEEAIQYLTIHLLNDADGIGIDPEKIETADVTIFPAEWVVGNLRGVKAYLGAIEFHKKERVNG